MEALIAKLGNYEGPVGLMLGITLFFLVSVAKKLFDTEENRVKDSKEETHTVIISLDKNSDALNKNADVLMNINLRLDRIEQHEIYHEIEEKVKPGNV